MATINKRIPKRVGLEASYSVGFANLRLERYECHIIQLSTRSRISGNWCTKRGIQQNDRWTVRYSH